MEKHKLDKLFSDKLQDFEQEPAIDAWEQLEDQLNKKNKRSIWPLLGIAASTAMVVLSSWYMIANSSATKEEDSFSYAAKDLSSVEVPVRIIYIPVIIQLPQQSTKPVNHKKENTTMLASVSRQEKSNITQAQESPQKHEQAQDMALNSRISPVLQKPLPVSTEDSNEVVLVSNNQPEETKIETGQVPLTIIYKQGAPKNKSKFTQAINYLEDVRNGDKKLHVFKKLRENIETKFKSNKEQNSK